MPDATVLLKVRDTVARITLNRPQAANTLNLEMAAALHDAALRCGDDRAVRAVVITGAGNSFSAGGDLKSFAAQSEQLPAHLNELVDHFHAAISHFARMDAPVIAAVNGVAAGAGMSLACACDFVVAAESARFTMAYTRAGLSPDGASTYFLPRLVGLRRALELTLTNRLLSATEALEWGLVTRVVPDTRLAEEVDALAAQLANGATHALGAAKRLLGDGWTETLETQMAHELHTIATMAGTSDVREGITAFLEKRPPRFTGQ
jgi:2-(1,2-epoxy-1,2-dihydrophenyl)acetyl-CoA isomerase